jgi:hypothetical protein
MVENKAAAEHKDEEVEQDDNQDNKEAEDSDDHQVVLAVAVGHVVPAYDLNHVQKALPAKVSHITVTDVEFLPVHLLTVT